jgi:GNAT superfamily N-acetyltransferase
MTSLGEYTFQQERFTESLVAEFHPVLLENHGETGVYALAFNPDYKRYIALDEMGALIVFTIRKAGALVGTAAFFLDTQIQQKDIVSATQSVNYIDKGHRGIGIRFMKFCDEFLKGMGVDSVWRQATVKHDVGKLYERMGYIPIETSYLRRL